MNRGGSASKYLILIGVILVLAATIVAGLWLRNDKANPTAHPSTNTETSQKETNQPKLADYQVKIAYIAVGDNGQAGTMIGCGDSVVLVDKMVNASSAAEGALRALLADKSEHYGQSGLYNALWQSTLTLDKVTITGQTAHIALSGQTQLSGECDDPRVKAQIESTVLQTGAATTVDVTLNGKSLDDALSLK